MINIKVSEWQNIRELSAPKLLDEMRPAAGLAMKEALVLFEGEVKKTLSGSRSGRTYKVSDTGAMHIAAAPGEPPAVLLGHLRNSVGHTGPTWEGATVSGEVGPGLGQAPSGDAADPGEAYARIQELGGMTGRGHAARIPPHPYMAPTAERVEPRIQEIFRKRVGS